MGGEEMECVSTHLIDGKGKIDEKGLLQFSELTGLSKCRLNYTIVAIMGPQSGGKSTLLNHLFKSNFIMMDAKKRRSQTILGIWLAKSPIIDRCTIIMDLEGNDGRERGDDHSFEMKIALFSLVLSDTLLINMWYQDIGRDNAANKPLLRIIFQAMLLLFTSRKTSLLFVIRDMGQTPLEILSDILLEDTLEIWNTIRKPKNNQDAAFDDYFVLDVVGLSNYELAKDKFMEDVDELRKRFSSPSEASLQTKPLVPAIDFVTSTSEIWDKVVNDKTLDIPSHKVMIAKVRCEQIDNDKFNGFIANQDWSRLKGAVSSPPVPGFGSKVTSMVDKCLAEYNEEAEFYDEVIKADHREKLKQRLLQEIKPVLESLMVNISSQALKDFKLNLDKDLIGEKKFREAADWSKMLVNFDSDYKDSRIEQSEETYTKVRDELELQLSKHVDFIRSTIQIKLTNQVKSKLKSGLTESMEAILKKPESNMWVNLNVLFQQETESACSMFSVGLEDLGTNDTAKVDEANEMLKGYGRDIIEKNVRKETCKILQLMQDKFFNIILNESEYSSTPRSWKGSDKIQDIVKAARARCVNIMSAMAIMRLDINKESDNIQQILSNALLEGGGEGSLTSNKWDGVEQSKTLMSPASCATIWDHFLKSSGIIITSVKQTIQARNDADNIAAAAAHDNNNQQPQGPQQHQPNVLETVLRTAFPVPALAIDLIGKLF